MSLYSSSDLQALWRDEVADTALPYLWSAAAFYSYLDEAQREFCRKTEGIEDARTTTIAGQAAPGLTTISVVPGTDWYSISPLILKLRTATRLDTGVPIKVISPERMDDFGIRFDLVPGPVDTIVQGLERHAVRIWPMPNETMTIQMSILRLPLVTINDDDQAMEIDDQHLLSLLMWVKYRAYDKQDEDTYDKKRALDFKDRFIAYCEEAKDAQRRARHNPGPVAYGGIPITGAPRSPTPPRYGNTYY